MKKLTKILSVAKTVAFVVVLALAGISLLTLLPLRTPIKPFIVLSGSMKPTIPEGSIAFIVRGQTENIKIGDIITYKRPDKAQENVTHRVAGITTIDGKEAYKTKGDANNDLDLWTVRKEAIWGKLAFSIPFLGFVINFTRTRLGVVLVIVLPLILIALDEIRVIVQEIKKMRKKKEPITEVLEELVSPPKKTHETKKHGKHVKAAVIALLFSTTLLCHQTGETWALFNDTVHAIQQEINTSWWVPPTVELISPNGGQTLYQGNTYSIMWDAASADPSVTVSLDIYYSTDGGATYPNLIATGETNDGIYSWVAPNIFSDTVRIRIVATDVYALTNEDTSNANFSIDSPIVMNEFLPNPTGFDNAAMPGGEWVELRNNGSVPVDVNGWVLYDYNDTNELTVSTGNSDNDGDPADAGETVVPGGGFLVVYRNADGDFELNNTGGDSVRLYNAAITSAGVLIDSYTYTLDPVPNNKSFARIPDGTGPWIDPDPTPGRPNVLTETMVGLPDEPEEGSEAAIIEEQFSEPATESATPSTGTLEEDGQAAQEEATQEAQLVEPEPQFEEANTEQGDSTETVVSSTPTPTPGEEEQAPPESEAPETELAPASDPPSTEPPPPTNAPPEEPSSPQPQPEAPPNTQ